MGMCYWRRKMDKAIWLIIGATIILAILDWLDFKFKV